MIPEALLAEAASAVQAEDERDVLEEASGILAAERARTTLASRFVVGRPVSIDGGSGGATRAGTVRAVGPDLVVIDDGSREHAVGLAHVRCAAGLSDVLGEPEPVPSPVRWGRYLRGLGDIGCEIEIVGGSVIRGRVGGVGADHVDVVAEAALTIPFAALRRVSSPTRTDA